MSELLTAQASSIKNTPFSQYIPWLTPPSEEARSPLTDIPPHPLSFLASLEGQNIVTLMQKAVTLQSQEAEGGFEWCRDGASKSPLYNCTGARKMISAYTLWGYACSCPSAQALQAHGNIYMLWMNSGHSPACSFWNSDHTEKRRIWIHMPFSPGVIHPYISIYVVIGFFFFLIYNFLLAVSPNF